MRVIVSAAVAFLLLPPAVMAGAEQQAAIESGCGASTNWSDAACTCIAAKAAAELDESQQAYLAGTLNGQDTSQIAAGLKAPELLEAAMYMMKQGPACQ